MPPPPQTSMQVHSSGQVWISLPHVQMTPGAQCVTAMICMVQVPWPQQTLRRLLEGKPTISSHLDAAECESQSQETQLSHQNDGSADGWMRQHPEPCRRKHGKVVV